MSPRARSTAALLLSVSLLASGCARASKSAPPTLTAAPQTQAAAAPGQAAEKQLPTRKVIRKAEVRLQSDDLAKSQQAASTMAEKLGGFVLSTDARHDADEGADDDHAITTMVVRVPAEHFGEALEQVRKMGSRVDEEKISGEDVTDQYVDLEARLKVQTAFEERLLGLLKDAHNVKDELEVEKQISEVRNEIERVEGRRRLLADQASLSTFTLTFTRRMPITSAAATGLGDTFRHATSDAVTLFWAILRGAIRVTGVLIPMVLLIGLPAFLVVRTVRALRRRRALTTLVRQTAKTPRHGQVRAELIVAAMSSAMARRQVRRRQRNLALSWRPWRLGGFPGFLVARAARLARLALLRAVELAADSRRRIGGKFGFARVDARRGGLVAGVGASTGGRSGGRRVESGDQCGEGGGAHGVGRIARFDEKRAPSVPPPASAERNQRISVANTTTPRTIRYSPNGASPAFSR